MDLPFPRIMIEQGEIDISNAFQQSLGAWDQEALRFGYRLYNDEERSAFFVKTWQKGYRFITMKDGIGANAAHAYAVPYDFGNDAILSLEQISMVKQLALDKLSRQALLSFQHDNELQLLLPDLLMFDLHQLKAVIRLIGGLEYDYSHQNASPWSWVALKFSKPH